MTLESTGTETLDLQQLLRVLQALRDGDLSQRMPTGQSGVAGEIAATINATFDQLNAATSEVTRIAREIGTEGRYGGQAVVEDVSGTWKELIDGVNVMAVNLTCQVRNITQITKRVADGELSRKITVDAQGETQELKEIVNTMVDRLQSFTSELTRIAREVGNEGKFGGQSAVKGVSGVWKDVTDDVNAMAATLTIQIRNMAEITRALADGDVSRKATVNARGEMAEYQQLLNELVDRLSSRGSPRPGLRV
jgi:HAMP domain-containing protein